MKIAGLQKVSTIDYPGKISCVIFLHGCNFRCGFCYNPELVTGKFTGGYREDEILRFLMKRRGMLDGVCITGGEPLIDLDLDFLKKIKLMGYSIKIDTNGSFPDKLKKIIDLGLVDYIAMDIKGEKSRYTEIINNSYVDISKIEISMRMVHDFGDGEFRTTILRRFHDEKSIIKMAEWVNNVCQDLPNRLFLQGFRTNDGLLVDEDFRKEKSVEVEYLEKLKNLLKPYFEEVVIRG